MRLKQLYEYIEQLLNEGIPEDILVCIPNQTISSLTTEISEIDRILIAKGIYHEDAPPKYSGLLQRKGDVLLMVSGIGMIELLTSSHTLALPGHPAPKKNDLA